MKEKPKRKDKPASRYLFWLMGAVALVWGIALVWGYTSYGTVTFTATSTPSAEDIASDMNDNFVMLGTSVPYCDYAAEIGVSPVLNEHELVVAMTVIPNISAVTVDHQTKTCFIRPQAGQPAEMTDRYIYRQAIDITAPIQKNDLARGNLIYAVFNALMPLDIDERTVVRLHFADEAGNTFGGWNQYYLSGVRAIETYTPATIWQQVR